MNQIEKQDRKLYKYDGYRKSTFINTNSISNKNGSKKLPDKLFEGKNKQNYLQTLNMAIYSK